MDIKELAAATGVSEKEVEIFARTIASELGKHGAEDAFIGTTSEERGEVTEAYAIHAAKMMRDFHTAYMTNTGLKSAFNSAVYAELKHDAITEHNKSLAVQGVKR